MIDVLLSRSADSRASGVGRRFHIHGGILDDRLRGRDEERADGGIRRGSQRLVGDDSRSPCVRLRCHRESLAPLLPELRRAEQPILRGRSPDRSLEVAALAVPVLLECSKALLLQMLLTIDLG